MPRPGVKIYDPQMSYPMDTEFVQIGDTQFDKKKLKKVNRFIKHIMCAAYVAGFDASSEGYNGEYLYPERSEDELYKELRKDFDKWFRGALAEFMRNYNR